VQHITVDRVQGTRFVQVHDPLVACLCAGPRGWSSRLRIGLRHGQDFVVGVRLQPLRVPEAFGLRDSLS